MNHCTTVLGDATFLPFASSATFVVVCFPLVAPAHAIMLEARSLRAGVRSARIAFASGDVPVHRSSGVFPLRSLRVRSTPMLTSHETTLAWPPSTAWWRAFSHNLSRRPFRPRAPQAIVKLAACPSDTRSARQCDHPSFFHLRQRRVPHSASKS